MPLMRPWLRKLVMKLNSVVNQILVALIAMGEATLGKIRKIIFLFRVSAARKFMDKKKPTLVEEALPDEAKPLTMADVMLELSVIGEVLAKRHKLSKVALELQNSGFHFTAFYKSEDEQEHRYISRKITDSLTPKGLAMVISEVKAGVGI